MKTSFTPSAAFLALPAAEQAAFLAKLDAGNAKEVAHLRVATEAEHAADVAATAEQFGDTSCVITTRRDLENFVLNARPDVHEHLGSAGVEAVTAHLQADDHPAWGRDWSEWLTAERVDHAVGVAAESMDH